MIPSLLTRTIEKLPPEVRLQGRVLFLLDDPELIRRQLAGEDVELTDEVRANLRDNISTDEITPAYICYYFDETLGEFPYLGLKAGSEFPIKQGSVRQGGFVASASGTRRGKGSSREQSPYAEMMAGIKVVIAENIERIYRENCQNLGVLTSTNFDLVERIRRGDTIPLTEFTDGADEITRGIIEHGGLFNYNVARLQGTVRTPAISCHHGQPGDAPTSTDAADVRAMRGSGEGNLPGPGPDTGVDYAAAQFVATSTSNVESDSVGAPEGTRHRGRRPMTIAEKIFARHWVTDLSRGDIGVQWVQPGDSGFVQTDIRFSHEYVTPMSAIFFESLVGPEERVVEPETILFFRDHLTFLKDAMPPERVQLGLLDVANQLEVKQRQFAEKQGVRLYGELGHGKHGSEAICHSKILEAYALPGHIIIGSDSHTPHAGAVGCVAFGVGTTAIFNSWITKDVRVEVPRSFKVIVNGQKPENVSAKDFMLEILRHPYIKDGHAIGQIIEYAGPAVESLSVDERATMTNMAAEVGAFTGIVAPDHKTVDYLVEQRGMERAEAERLIDGLFSDEGAEYVKVIEIDASALQPMIALPGDPGNGLYVEELGEDVRIDIAYAGSCTAGKKEDMDMYARVLREYRERGVQKPEHVQLYIQCGSQEVYAYCQELGYDRLFNEVGATFIEPSCGACINAGPGVSRKPTDVTISAINRNFPGRSGPGQLYLASPYTVAASAMEGRIVAWEPQPEPAGV
ncbi:MAG TPA: aconitase family protein [Longimicrobium sp.]|jgi:3-isopropylmalate/(R)-2-methylmalate dehydratase large subunit|uniref:aconitase family protein n=1 Tax=Longimicrobium sp. TaxID=2029185 RepID=UPI002ED9ED15